MNERVEPIIIIMRLGTTAMKERNSKMSGTKRRSTLNPHYAIQENKPRFLVFPVVVAAKLGSRLSVHQPIATHRSVGPLS